MTEELDSGQAGMTEELDSGQAGMTVIMDAGSESGMTRPCGRAAHIHPAG